MVRLKPEIHAAFLRLSEEHGISLNWFVNRACEQFLASDALTLEVAEVAL